MENAIMFWLEVQTGMPVTGIYWLLCSMIGVLIYAHWS